MAGSRAFAPVRVGVVGLGRFGQLHAMTLAGLAEAELVGVVARLAVCPVVVVGGDPVVGEILGEGVVGMDPVVLWP